MNSTTAATCVPVCISEYSADSVILTSVQHSIAIASVVSFQTPVFATSDATTFLKRLSAATASRSNGLISSGWSFTRSCLRLSAACVVLCISIR